MADPPDGTVPLLGDSPAPPDMSEWTAAEHLQHVHEHVKNAGEHADLASAHVKTAASHLENLEAADDGGGDGGHGDSDGRAMPASAQPAASAQARAYRFGGMAARTLSAATRGRR